MKENSFFEKAIQLADDETTAYEDSKTAKAKESNSWKGVSGIDREVPRKSTPLTQKGRNTMHAAVAMVRRGLRAISNKKQRVRFSNKTRIATYVESAAATVFATYDSGADDNYVSEADRAKAGWPILRPSSSRVRVANGEHMAKESM